MKPDLNMITIPNNKVHHTDRIHTVVIKFQNLLIHPTKTKFIHPHVQIPAHKKELQVMKLGNADDATKESGVPHYTYTSQNFLFHEQYILQSCYHISELYFDTRVCQLQKFGN